MIVYELEGYYEGEWEVLTCEESLTAARDRLGEYRENEGGRYRIMKRSTKHPSYRAC